MPCKERVWLHENTWFKRWNWLHYDESQDVAFCFPCLKAFKEKKLTGANPDKAFISNGFANWKVCQLELFHIASYL